MFELLVDRLARRWIWSWQQQLLLLLLRHDGHCPFVHYGYCDAGDTDDVFTMMMNTEDVFTMMMMMMLLRTVLAYPVDVHVLLPVSSFIIFPSCFCE